jgi:hypothetical protein
MRDSGERELSGGGSEAVVRPEIGPSVEPRVYRQLFDRETLAEYLRLSTDTIESAREGRQAALRSDWPPGALHA